MKQTSLQKYLTMCPASLNDEQRLYGLISDALENDAKKIHALQFAYKAGIVEIVRRDGRLTDEQKSRLCIQLTQEYSMVPEAVRFAIGYWEHSLTEGIIKEADAEKERMEAGRLTEMLSASAEQPENSDCIELCVIRQDKIHNAVTIQWNRRVDISRYEIWRAERGEPARCIAENRFPLPRYVDPEVEPGVKYAYAVRGWKTIDQTQVVDLLSNDAELLAPDTASTFQISEVKMAREGVSLRWPVCFGAVSYRIYKRDSENTDWLLMQEMPNTASQYTDSAVYGKRFYKLQCTLRDGSILETRDIKVRARFNVG